MIHILWKVIFYPLKWIWNIFNITRIIILNIITFFIIILFITIYCKTHNIPSINKPKKSALFINLSNKIKEKPICNIKLNYFNNIILKLFNTKLQDNSLFTIVEKIRYSKNDPNILGIILYLNNFSCSDYTTLQYIGKALKEFRDTNKPIYAISNNYNQDQYFIASYANTIYIDPLGSVNISGLSFNTLYFKQFLKNLKVNTHVFRIGKYKSAVEPIIRNNMSQETKEENTILINKLWSIYLNIIAKNRNISLRKLYTQPNIIIQQLKNLNGNTALLALNNKFIDKIMSYSEIEKEMSIIFGRNNIKNTFNKINIYDYNIPTINYPKNIDQIAIILINGMIINGKSNMHLTGSDTIIHQIRHAYLNKNIKGIILRINSPGGNIHAAESIRSELITARNLGKKIIVSMGKVAASGGYWISTPAHKIISHNNTITGSIGIFSIINTFENTLNAIGISHDSVSTSSLSKISMITPLPSEIIKIIKLNIQHGYKSFIQLVATSRNKTIEEVQKIAQGHIWLGQDAITNGLIDEIGDFDDAIDSMIKILNIKKYKLHWYNNKKNIFDLLITHNQSYFSDLIQNFIFSYPNKIIKDIHYNNNLLLTNNNIYYKNNNYDMYDTLYAICHF